MDASPHLMAPTQEEEFKGDKRLARISHTHRRSMVNCKFAWLAKPLRVTERHRQGWPKKQTVFAAIIPDDL
jgi:hypothetical protein